MKKNKYFKLAVSASLALSLVKVASGMPITFESNDTWNVFDSSNNLIGPAQNVCLNDTSPSTCPPGSTVYGYSGSAWGADLSSISGANWIWAPGITGLSTSASLAQYSFVKEFDLIGVPQSGSISLSVDDFAEIFVNNTLVGTVGSITNLSLAISAQSLLSTFDISSFLISGINRIRVTAQNGPDSFSGISNSNYSQNPAGVVFGGALTAMPEPSTFFLFCIGGLFLVGIAKARRNATEGF